MTWSKMQRRHSPSHPLHWRLARLEALTQNVNSADRFLAAACHFGGSIAKYAKIANLVHIYCNFCLKD
jgi:hypothetical protein